MKVLSTYRFQILGLRVAFAIACSSNSSIRFARTQTSAVSELANETGDIPIWSKVKLIVTPTGTHVGSKRLSI